MFSLSIMISKGAVTLLSTASVIQGSIDVPSCQYALEFMFLQDRSGSFLDDQPVLRQKLPLLIGDIDSKYPQSQYGFASFIDKPISPFGFPSEGDWFRGDYCLEVDSKLAFGDVLPRVHDFTDKPVGGGRDWPENQLGALLDLAKDDASTGWTNTTYTAQGRPIVRLIVMSTDAIYHMAGDAAGPPHNMVPNKGTGRTECLKEDYPTVPQVSMAMQELGSYSIFLISNSTQEPLIEVYQDLLKTMGTPGSVHTIASDSSDIIEKMEEAFPTMTDRVCNIGAIDIAFIQDVTYSFSNDMPQLHKGIKDIIKDVESYYVYPRWSLATFGDKPISPFGHGPSGDYCYYNWQPMTFDPTEIEKAAAQIETTSGMDWKESQLDGMISALYDTKMDWRTGSTWKGFVMRRIAVLATDSGFHIAGDAAKHGHSLRTRTTGTTVNCEGEDYPNVLQLATALKALDVRPVFVPTSDIKMIYDDLLEQLAQYGVVGHVVELKDFLDIRSAVYDGVQTVVAKS